MIDDFEMGPLLQALEKARRPWREANRAAVVDKVALATLSMLEANQVRPDNALKQANMGMYVLGLSNIVTLALAGNILQEVPKDRQFEVLKLAVSIAWFRLGGAYMWEDATVMRPEEFANNLDKVMPTVPKGAWTLRAKFRPE